MNPETDQQGTLSRAAAARAVNQVLVNGATLERALADNLPAQWATRDQAQVRALAFGTLRWHCRHRQIINELLHRPIRKRDRVLEALLSVGLFQLLQPRQPEYAAVSATVGATRVLDVGWAAGLVNAALRRFQRDQKKIMRKVLATTEGRYSQPQWLIEHVRADWPDQWQEQLDAALEPPPLWIRVNRNRITPEEYRERLENELQIPAQSQAGFPDALRLETALPATELPGFANGLVSVQDAASQVAPDLLGASGSMRVLDACAAPGGKATHLLERCDGKLDLFALDVDGERLARVEENLARLGLSARVIAGDAREPGTWWDGRVFDRILLDAPCSATGVIRRHPDIRFLRRPGDIETLAIRQTEMLEQLWPLLTPGGALLYCTCSVLREENEAVVEEFIARQEDVRIKQPLVGAVLNSLWPLAHGYQFLPEPEGVDGIYYALMTKQPS